MNKKNGNTNILNEQQQEMRESVVDLELKARYWKAQYELRHFTLLTKDIEEEYQAYIQSEKEKEEKARAEFIEQLEKMRAQEGVEVTESPKEEEPINA